MHCIYCGRELPGQESICRQCLDDRYIAPAHINVSPKRKITRLLRFAPVTCSLVAINTLLFLLMLREWDSIFGPSDSTLIKWGADFGPLTLDGQWWRLFTATFIHFDVGHIFFNMLGLLSLGRIAERAFGKVTFVVAYLGAGLFGSLASQYFH